AARSWGSGGRRPRAPGSKRRASHPPSSAARPSRSRASATSASSTSARTIWRPPCHREYPRRSSASRSRGPRRGDALVSRRLIVNADDSGLRRGVSAGILSAHRHGIVTSTTLLATAAIDAELLAALRDSGLGVGIHLNLTLGRPLTGGRSLVDADGRFVRDANHAAARADARDVEREVNAQIEKFAYLMRREPTHLDTHHHVGLLAPVTEVLLDAARRLGVAVRSQNATARARALTAGLRTPDHFFGES